MTPLTLPSPCPCASSQPVAPPYTPQGQGAGARPAISPARTPATPGVVLFMLNRVTELSNGQYISGLNGTDEEDADSSESSNNDLDKE